MLHKELETRILDKFQETMPKKGKFSLIERGNLVYMVTINSPLTIVAHGMIVDDSVYVFRLRQDDRFKTGYISLDECKFYEKINCKKILEEHQK